MQELQNWFRIFCTLNGLQFTTLPSLPGSQFSANQAGPKCELNTVRGTKNPKPVMKFLHNRYSFLRVSPESEIQCPPLVFIHVSITFEQNEAFFQRIFLPPYQRSISGKTFAKKGKSYCQEKKAALAKVAAASSLRFDGILL